MRAAAHHREPAGPVVDDDKAGIVDDQAEVAALLGRPPAGDFEVAVRDARGGPVVIRNAPLLRDGTPTPSSSTTSRPTALATLGA